MGDDISHTIVTTTPLPRVTIQFCTQCKWMLRAAYYAQELLSTFSTALGEVALQPSTGGTFIVTIYSSSSPSADAGGEQAAVAKVLWDRKTDVGFPETKELKRRVRDVIEPGRDLGHVDRDYSKKGKEGDAVKDDVPATGEKGEGKGVEGEACKTGDGKTEKEHCADCQ